MRIRSAFLVVLFGLFAQPALATVSVDCLLTPDNLSTLNVSFPTSTVTGYPIIGDVEFSGSGAKYSQLEGERISKDQVVNYRNYRDRLFVLVLDENFDKEVLRIEYNWNSNKGKAWVSRSVTDVATKEEESFSNIKCEFL